MSNTDTPKTKVAIFVTQDEARAIKARAAMEGKTVSRLVVESILGDRAATKKGQKRTA